MSGSRPRPRDLVFFLGGHDLEMETIRDLLEQAGAEYVDHGLDWGARASLYRDEVATVLRQGKTPVLVELEDDIGLDPERTLVVDHHGSLAGAEAPTSLEQVFQLLDLPRERWTRHLELVAANDRAHLRGLKAVGASREEAERIRRQDRRAQGITEEQEESAQRSAEEIKSRLGGVLHVAHMDHDRTAALVDRLAPGLGGPGFRNLVVLSPGEVNVFGEGPVIRELAARVPGGWYGGALPAEGFWGRRGGGEEVLRFVEETLENEKDTADDDGGPTQQPTWSASRTL